MNAYYGNSHVLHGIDLLVHPAELLVVAGRNGAGKTTLLKSILGLSPVFGTSSIVFKTLLNCPEPYALKMLHTARTKPLLFSSVPFPGRADRFPQSDNLP